MTFVRMTLVALTGTMFWAGSGVIAEEAAPAPEAKPAEAKPAEAAPAAPAADPAVKKAAKDAFVVIDGVQYNWEEAVRKFPEMKASAPAHLAFDPNYQSTPETAPKPAAETVTVPAIKAEAKKEEVKEEKKEEKKEVSADTEKADKEARKAAEKAEKEKRKAAEKAEKAARKAAEERKKRGEPALPPVTEPDPAHAERLRLEQARDRVALEDRIQKLIRRLTTENWKEAQGELFKIGKDAVPFLIATLAPAEQPVAGEPPLEAYAAGAPGRPTRTRPLSEMAFEVLDTLIRSRSDFHGAVPMRDQKAWEAFWAANGATITLGNGK